MVEDPSESEKESEEACIEIRQLGIADERYWRILTRGVWVALGAHAIFIAISYAIGATFLVVVNIGSVSIYVVCIVLLRRGLTGPVILLVWVEVIGFTALAVGSLGWDSGFHYYLLVFTPFVFISSTRKPGSKVGLAMLLCILYAGMDGVMRFVPPLSTVDPVALSILRYANITACFAALGYFAFFYGKTVGEAEQRLRIMATTDSLTGLYNRRHIIEIAEYEKMRRKRSHHPLAFIIADIDNFKSVNDRYGHEIGDQTLVVVSRQVRGVLREQDSLARWGGEEFLMLLPDTGSELAAAVAQRIRETIAVTPVRQGEDDLTITMTLGVSEHREDESVEACIARADQALYRGKEAGKNRVEQG